jgi:hypothetical protein
MSGQKFLQHQTPEQLREHSDRQEEALAAGDPLFAIFR